MSDFDNPNRITVKIDRTLVEHSLLDEKDSERQAKESEIAKNLELQKKIDEFEAKEKEAIAEQERRARESK